ncbi:C-3 sterol dehydrogenase/C-4 decarboxylase family protein [Aspergillus foveolatus]|uniref:C-3 sterol dehydrogenase/C-4 decarboxylase family protein n=1 Tax=Aspergillus foveolatus TaxID=210207 RepID=UPI003CCC94A8
MDRRSRCIGPVLLTGGNGFIAYHIIAKILEEDPSCVIHSLDINIDRNRHPNANVHYHQADIASAADVEKIMNISQPVTIFHLASPAFSGESKSTYTRVMVHGARNLLLGIEKVQSVKALVNTSVTGLINDNVSDMINATEDMPVLRPPQQKLMYSIMKLESDEIIQAANRRNGLLTCSLRPCLTFGERDVGSLGKMIAVARAGRANLQVGHGQNLWDFAYVGNVADAHLLCAHALLDAWGKPPPAEVGSDMRVDGETFHITNDDPWLFWDFQRSISSQLGKPVQPEEIRVIPAWIPLTVASIIEWIGWLFSWGIRPSLGTSTSIRYSTIARTHDISKAKRVLGYRPRVSMREGLERSVKSFVENEW